MKRVYVVMALLIASWTVAQAKSRVSVYYPSPYGEYKELRAEAVVVGSEAFNSTCQFDQSLGGWDCGGVVPGTTPTPTTSLTVLGSVGIGVAPAKSRLDVAGGMIVGENFAGSATPVENGLKVEGSMLMGGEIGDTFFTNNSGLPMNSANILAVKNKVGSYDYWTAIGSDGVDDWGIGIFDTDAEGLIGWFSYNSSCRCVGLVGGDPDHSGKTAGVLILGSAPVQDPNVPENTSIAMLAGNGSIHLWGEKGIMLSNEQPLDCDDARIPASPKPGIAIASHGGPLFMSGPGVDIRSSAGIDLWGSDLTGHGVASVNFSSANAQFRTVCSTGGDYAEYLPAEETLEPGDLVELDVDTGMVRKYRGKGPYIGVVSENPVVIGNYDPAYENDPSYALIALAGQVNIDEKQVYEEERVVYTKDKKYRVGYRLKNGKVLLK